MKSKFQEQVRVWGPRVAFFAVFGFTGLVCLGAVKVFKSVKSIEDTIKNTF